MSKMFWRPKIVQIFVTTHYIYTTFPACHMFSDCHWCTERNAQCNIVHRIVLHKPIGSKKAWNLLWLMACPKIVQENIGWPTEVRIGFGHFRRSKMFGLRFTALLWTLDSARRVAHFFPILENCGWGRFFPVFRFTWICLYQNFWNLTTFRGRELRLKNGRLPRNMVTWAFSSTDH